MCEQVNIYRDTATSLLLAQLVCSLSRTLGLFIFFYALILSGFFTLQHFNNFSHTRLFMYVRLLIFNILFLESILFYLGLLCFF